MKKIILITGGERSGKSSYAEKLALSLLDNPVYIATAHIWDDEFRERVRIHKERRGPQWTNIEEEVLLSNCRIAGKCAVIDCITLWLTNILQPHLTQDGGFDVNKVLEEAKKIFNEFTAQDALFIFVTNEIGSGGVSSNVMQRNFTDLQGFMNQYIASMADEVILMISGVPVKIKGEK